MSRTEPVELTVLCLLEHDGCILLQDRLAADWRGYTLPGGHVEPNEGFVDAAVREMQEETGLTVLDPRLCGVKQFPTAEGRYVVLLFRASVFTGQLKSSDEGQMHWVPLTALSSVNLVPDFWELLQVMESDDLSEFCYVPDGEQWNVILK